MFSSMHKLMIAALTATVVALLTYAAIAQSIDSLDRARRQFDQHNYQSALRAADLVLRDTSDEQTRDQASVLRARCLIKLGRWDEGIQAFETILRERPNLERDPELHLTVAEGATQQPPRAATAVKHFARAFELFLENDRADQAAQAAFQCAQTFVHFADWTSLEGYKRPATDNWQESRRLQREHAVTWLDRAIEHAGDSRLAAEAMFRKGTLFSRDLMLDGTKDIATSIEVFTDLVQRWPQSQQAPHAAFDIARLQAQYQQDYVAAVNRYRFVAENFSGSRLAVRALQQIREIQQPQVNIGVDGPASPGEKPYLHVQTRNVARISFAAYSVDLFDLIRRIGHPSRLDQWSAPGSATKSWSEEIADGGEHKFYTTGDGSIAPIEIPITEPGAYIIVANVDGLNPAATQNRTLFIVSELSAVAKGARNGGIVWLTNAGSGRPWADADVLAQEALGGDDYRNSEGRTNSDGLFSLPVDDRPERGGRSYVLFARSGRHFALCNSSSYWFWWGYQGDYRAYAFTDRPIYRPGQEIHFKNVVRRYAEGQYANAPDTAVSVTVRDPKGETVYEKTLTTNDQGSIVGEFSLPKSATLGAYHMQWRVAGRYVDGGAGSRFRIEEYRKPEYQVAVGASDARYALNDTVDVRLEAKYYFGSPVAGAKVSYTVHRTPIQPAYSYPFPYPWYFNQLAGWWQEHNMRCMPDFCMRPWEQPQSLVQRGEMETDDVGLAIVRIAPQSDQLTAAEMENGFRYIVDAEVTDSSRRTVTGTGSVNVTPAPFTIQLTPQRRLYQPGDTVHIDVTARGPNGEKVAFEGKLNVHRIVSRETNQAGLNGTEPLELGDRIGEEAFTADGEGKGRVRFTVDEVGAFRFVVTAGDTDGAEVHGECDVWVAKGEGRLEHYAFRDVELIPDKYVYEIGETARVLVQSRFEEAKILFTAEADDLLSQRLIEVSRSGTVIEIPIAEQHTPNFYLTATVVRDGKVFQDMHAIVVPPTRQFLNVALHAPADTFLPGESVEVTAAVTDSTGEPVAAELAVMMVDASLYGIQPEFRAAVQEFFYGQVRPHMVTTMTSFDFSSGRYDYRFARTAVREGAAFAQVAGDVAAAPMAMKVMSADGGAPMEQEFAAAKIRRDFPDSVLWLGQRATGADGRVAIDLTFGETLTTWRLIAVAIDRDTRVGEAARDLITRKDVIARLQTPRFLVEGDTCFVSVIARNDLPSEKVVRVTLEANGPMAMGQVFVDGQRAAEQLRGSGQEKEAGGSPSQVGSWVDVMVKSGSEAVVDFEMVAVSPGQAVFTGTAATDEQSDGMEVTLPILEFGAPKLLARTGVMRRDDPVSEQLVTFSLPLEMDTQTPILEVHISPTIAGVMLDAIPYLIEYPYGCTEQTMSRFLPAVLTRHTLDKMGVQLEELAKRASGQAEHDELGRRRRWGRHLNPVFRGNVLDDVVASGLARLAELQRPDGGWGWWKEGRGDAYMTAYVVYGLSEAKRAGVAVDAGVLGRGVEHLKRQIGLSDEELFGPYRWGGELNQRMWMVYALGVAEAGNVRGGEVRVELDRIYDGRDDLTDYGRAMLALTLQRRGDAGRAKVVIENLENTVRVDEETQTASWGQGSGYYRWYDNGLEATAMVLRALLSVSPDDPHIHGAANWLVRNRQGNRWHSTKDTALAVYALADYLEWSGELEAAMSVTVTLDGGVSRTFEISPDNVLTSDLRMIFAPRHVGPGEHEVRIVREGRGSVYHATYVDFYTKEDPIAAEGGEVRVNRKYERLIPKEVERSRRVWDGASRKYVEETYKAVDYDREPIVEGAKLASGDLIEVTLEIEALNDFEYMIIEDPKPAGCEAESLLSGGESGGGVYTHMELRDQHVAMFAHYLRQGKVSPSYRLRCERPGKFSALPTRVEAMYSPYVRANGASGKLEIGLK